jgi:hypothetical protein
MRFFPAIVSRSTNSTRNAVLFVDLYNKSADGLEIERDSFERRSFRRSAEAIGREGQNGQSEEKRQSENPRQSHDLPPWQGVP